MPLDEYLLIALVNILIGALEIVMGIPLLLQKVKPNWFYGFRLPETISNKELWYKTNKYFGRDFIVAGIIIIIVSPILLIFGSNFSIIDFLWIEVILVIAPIFIVLIRGFIYLKKISN